MFESPLFRRNMITATVTGGLALMGLHFLHEAQYGSTGLVEMVGLERKEERLTTELAELIAKRERAEKLNARLSREALDLDLLDERARVVLGHIRADEIVIR